MHEISFKRKIAPMLKKVKLHLALCIGLAVLTLPACATAKSYLIVVSTPTYKFAHFEHSYNSLAFSAAQKVRDALGATVEVVGLDTSKPNPMEKLLAQNYDVIITVGNDMGLAARKIAKDYPEQKFAFIDFGDGGLPPNACSYQFDGSEGAFLAGYLAARVSTVNELGFVGGQVFPQVQKMGRAFAEGARYANSHIEVTNVYVNDFFDIPGGRNCAAALYDDGVEVIFHAAGLSGHGVIEAAQNAGKWVIGVDANQYQLAPENVLTSVIIDIEMAIMNVCEATENNLFPEGQRIIMDLANDGVRLGDTSNIAPEIMHDLQYVMERVRTGDIVINKIL